jgi:leader peptidase (prepilin peptidase)/N-methyltransferase
MALTILALPPVILSLYAFVWGAIIGSFLNVYIYRFHTGKSLSGHSHCLSCGIRLSWHDLVPLFSYLRLCGKCRACGCAIPSRYFFVEAATGALFTASAFVASSIPEMLYLWVVLAILVVIAVYDLRHYIIPDSLTISTTSVVLVWYGYQWCQGVVVFVFIHNIIAALLGAGFFFFLWFISKGRWIGFGDVKLAFPLGLMVGTTLVFSMIVFSFWIGATVSLLMVALAHIKRGKLYLRFLPMNLTIKSVVPFAPFLIAGCLLVLFTRLDVFTLFTF